MYTITIHFKDSAQPILAFTSDQSEPLLLTEVLIAWADRKSALNVSHIFYFTLADVLYIEVTLAS